MIAKFGDRAQLANALERLACPGRILDPWGPDATWRDPGAFMPARAANAMPIPRPQRLRLHREIADALDSQRATVPASDGRVFLTAGAPGSGKTTTLRQEGWYDDCVVVDPDSIKVELMRRLLPHDEHLHAKVTVLANAIGAPVAPTEAAALVHEESLILATVSFRHALRSSRRVCLTGTCTDEHYVRRILRLAHSLGRDRCEALVLDVPEHLAQARAADRWWRGRVAFIEGQSPLGERFVPRHVISRSYEDGRCRAVAALRSVVERPEQGIALQVRRLT